MEQENGALVPKGRAIALAVVVSIAPIYWTGIGGVLIALCASVAAVIIASSALSKDSAEVRREMEGSAQLEGILDSSQLDAAEGQVRTEPVAYDRARRFGKMVVAIAIVVSALASGLVLASTGGRGVHFYLGGRTLFPSAAQDSDTARTTTTHRNTRRTTSSNEEEEEYYSEEWTYYPEEEGEEETWVPESTQQETSQPGNTSGNQGTSEPTAPTQPAQPTQPEVPSNAGTQDDAAPSNTAQPTADPATTTQDAPATTEQAN